MILLSGVRYLGDLAETGRVNGPVLGADGYRVPALVLRLIHSASSSSTRVFLGQKLLLHFNLLPMFLQLRLFMDLVDCFRALVTSAGDPVILYTQNRPGRSDQRQENGENRTIFVQIFDPSFTGLDWVWLRSFLQHQRHLLFTPSFYNQCNIYYTTD